MNTKTTALFGGTFDPVHLGHTTVAENAAEQVGAEKVILIPAKCSPLKTSGPVAGDKDRLEMLRLAVQDKWLFEVSDYELKKAGPSYTLETVLEARKKLGSVKLHWFVGADVVDELTRWYKIKELIDQCNLTLMHRAGCDRPDLSKYKDFLGPERVEKLNADIVETPLIDISSTEIRRRIARNEPVEHMLDKKVADYISRHQLYKDQA